MTDPNSQRPVNGKMPPPVAILRVVLVYAAFAALWILLSDKAVAVLFRDPARIILVSTLKGWLFVGVTSLLLYALMRRLPCRGERLGVPQAPLRSLVLPLTLLSLAIVGLTGGGIAHSLIHQKEKEVARLQAIADLKTRQIADWLRERHGDALFVEASQFWTELYYRWRDGGDGASLDLLRGRLDRYRQNNAFQGVLLLDEEGAPLWDSQNRTFTIAPSLAAVAREAVSDRLVHNLGPYRDLSDLLHLDFVAPLPAVDGRPGPVVVLRADPAAHLFPTLQTWPVPSPSGDIVLFKRDGDQVLFLNELRHRADTAVKLRLPVTEERLLAAQVVRGEARLGSLVEGVDYRGVAVLGVVRAIPGSDWFLVAKVDRAEVIAEATDDLVWIGLAGLLALFVTTIAALLFRQRQELAFALREQEVQAERLKALQLLDSIATSSTDAIYAKDGRGRYLLFNQAAARCIGRRPEEVLGLDDSSILLPSEEAARVMTYDRQVMADNRVVTCQEELVTPAGARTFLTTKGPLLDSEGQVIGLFGISRDITEIKEAETALRESEASLARAQAIAHVGSWRYMIQSGELTWSAETCRIFGVPVGAPVTMELFLAAIHPEDKARVFAVREGAISTATPYAVDYRILVKGAVKWVRGQGEVSLDAGGWPLVSFGVIQDITERRRAEDERERLQAQLLQAQKMESVGRLAGGVAHDFNNMLSVIIGHAELALIREDLPLELAASLKEIEKAAERSAALTRQLLAFARKQAIAPKVLDLNDTTAGMLKMLRRLIGEDIDLAWMPGPHLWPIRIDPAQVDQILANLAVNARDAIAGVGRITIRTESVTLDEGYCATHPSFVPGDFVMLTVSDDGCGMEEEVMAQIFDPFFTTKEVGQGTGLGLATVYGIVRQNQGAIEVESEPGQGTTFRIALPRYTGQEVTPSVIRQRHTPAGRGEKVLLVEDEAAIREVTRAMLERLGYTVQAAETPAEALTLVESGVACDLLVTDVVMPVMNGRDLMERLRLQRPGLKALFMSGYTADILAQQGGVLEEGVRFIQKPFSLHDLGVRVREMLAASGQ